MKIKDLEIGTTFDFMGERLKLLKKNDCRVLVRPNRKVRREWEDARTGKLVAFDAPAGAFSMSPGTVVENPALEAPDVFVTVEE